MTTVVVYNEFKTNNVKLSGGDRDDETVEVLAGATRKFELADGQMLTVGGDTPEAEHEKTRGPTISEFVAAGYDANNYPPSGYDAVSSQEEIDAAIAAQGKRAAPTGLNAEQVPGTFTPIPGKEPWDVKAEVFTPPPQPSFAKDPRNEEQKAKDAERADLEKQQAATADAADASKVATPEGYQAPFPVTAPAPLAPVPEQDREPPEEPGNHELLPGQPEPTPAPVPGIAALNEAESRIPEPAPGA